ncbi:MAG: lamin tail domain-containing protein [Candidatus Paceibacterota bacterium]
MLKKLLTSIQILIAFFAMFFPVIVFGEVFINEIMYDLEGSDTDREWIEVCNNGSDPVDISSWKLFESNSNHTLNKIQGDGIISAGGFAIIADNSQKFLVDNPQFSGTLFDSSFSLSNEG